MIFDTINQIAPNASTDLSVGKRTIEKPGGLITTGQGQLNKGKV